MIMYNKNKPAAKARLRKSHIMIVSFTNNTRDLSLDHHEVITGRLWHMLVLKLHCLAMIGVICLWIPLRAETILRTLMRA